MSLAIFDLDNTLIQGQSQFYLLLYAFRNKKVGILSFLFLFFWFLGYKLGVISDPNTIINYAYSKILKGQDVAELNIFLGKFYEEILSKKVDQAVVDKLNKHRQEGDKIILITNALKPLGLLISDKLGIDKVFATEPEIVNGRYSGMLTDQIVYGENKAKIINNNYSIAELVGSYAYADHYSDAPLFELVDNKVFVRPDSRLIDVAKARSWKIYNI